MSLLLLIAAFQATTTPPDEPVIIRSDGWNLAGSFRLAPNAGAPAVLLLNGAARDRRAYVGLAGELASRGIASLRLDLRAEGESTNLGRYEPGRDNALLQGSERDVVAALAWLRQRPGVDPERIGIVGASYSGEAAAVAARLGGRARAYVALSPGSFSDTSIAALDRDQVPWWFLASRQERFAVRVVEDIATRSRSARVTIVEGTSHGSDLLSPHWNLEAEIADWFASRLGGLLPPPLWGGLQPGAHRVGFRRLTQGGLYVDLWYPTAAGSAPMTVTDYLVLSDDLRGAVPGSPAATISAAISGDTARLGFEVAGRLLRSPLFAARDASPAAGSFPLLLWTPRYGTTLAQSALSEMIASHGFIVAFPRPVAPALMPFEASSPGAKRAELDARVNDMRNALAVLRTRREVDAGAVGVLAWSYTGEMATAFQMSEPAVRLVVGLSTNLLDGWVYQPREAAASLDSTRTGAAYALLSQRGEIPPALKRVSGARYYVHLPGMTHGGFNALEGYWPSLLGITTVQPFSGSNPDGIRGYEAVGAMLLRLARHHVAGRRGDRLSNLVLTSGIDPETAVPLR